ncbi:unnamed protein product [Closterium sp. NIES-54]
MASRSALASVPTAVAVCASSCSATLAAAAAPLLVASDPFAAFDRRELRRVDPARCSLTTAASPPEQTATEQSRSVLSEHSHSHPPAAPAARVSSAAFVSSPLVAHIQSRFAVAPASTAAHPGSAGSRHPLAVRPGCSGYHHILTNVLPRSLLRQISLTSPCSSQRRFSGCRAAGSTASIFSRSTAGIDPGSTVSSDGKGAGEEGGAAVFRGGASSHPEMLGSGADDVAQSHESDDDDSASDDSAMADIDASAQGSSDAARSSDGEGSADGRAMGAGGQAEADAAAQQAAGLATLAELYEAQEKLARSARFRESVALFRAWIRKDKSAGAGGGATEAGGAPAPAAGAEAAGEAGAAAEKAERPEWWNHEFEAQLRKEREEQLPLMTWQLYLHALMHVGPPVQAVQGVVRAMREMRGQGVQASEETYHALLQTALARRDANSVLLFLSQCVGASGCRGGVGPGHWGWGLGVEGTRGFGVHPHAALCILLVAKGVWGLVVWVDFETPLAAAPAVPSMPCRSPPATPSPPSLPTAPAPPSLPPLLRCPSPPPPARIPHLLSSHAPPLPPIPPIPPTLPLHFPSHLWWQDGSSEGGTKGGQLQRGHSAVCQGAPHAGGVAARGGHAEGAHGGQGALCTGEGAAARMCLCPLPSALCPLPSALCPVCGAMHIAPLPTMAVSRQHGALAVAPPMYWHSTPRSLATHSLLPHLAAPSMPVLSKRLPSPACNAWQAHKIQVEGRAMEHALMTAVDAEDYDCATLALQVRYSCPAGALLLPCRCATLALQVRYSCPAGALLLPCSRAPAPVSLASLPRPSPPSHQLMQEQGEYVHDGLMLHVANMAARLGDTNIMEHVWDRLVRLPHPPSPAFHLARIHAYSTAPKFSCAFRAALHLQDFLLHPTLARPTDLRPYDIFPKFRPGAPGAPEEDCFRYTLPLLGAAGAAGAGGEGEGLAGGEGGLTGGGAPLEELNPFTSLRPLTLALCSNVDVLDKVSHGGHTGGRAGETIFETIFETTLRRLKVAVDVL